MLIDQGHVAEKRRPVYEPKTRALPVPAGYARSIAHFLAADDRQISAAAQ